MNNDRQSGQYIQSHIECQLHGELDKDGNRHYDIGQIQTVLLKLFNKRNHSNQYKALDISDAADVLLCALVKSAKYLDTLGAEPDTYPDNPTAGTCQNLRRYLTETHDYSYHIADAVEHIMLAIGTTWEHYTGRKHYPVPSRKGLGGSFVKDLMLNTYQKASEAYDHVTGLVSAEEEAGVPRSVFTQPDSKPSQYMWAGKYGQLRREYCAYIALTLIKILEQVDADVVDVDTVNTDHHPEGDDT